MRCRSLAQFCSDDLQVLSSEARLAGTMLSEEFLLKTVPLPNALRKVVALAYNHPRQSASTARQAAQPVGQGTAIAAGEAMERTEWPVLELPISMRTIVVGKNVHFCRRFIPAEHTPAALPTKFSVLRLSASVQLPRKGTSAASYFGALHEPYRPIRKGLARREAVGGSQCSVPNSRTNA